VTGLDPATHVFDRGCVNCREDVDDRDEPGHGDLELFPGRFRQSISLNRTAVDLIRPSPGAADRTAEGNRSPGQARRWRL